MTELSPPGFAAVSECITNLWYALNIVKEVRSHGSAEVTAASRSAITTLRCSFSPKRHGIAHLAVDAGDCWRLGGIKLNLCDAFSSSCRHLELYVGGLPRMI